MLMKGEWPVLLRHHGQGRRRASATSAWPRSGRCSCERRFPERINGAADAASRQSRSGLRRIRQGGKSGLARRRARLLRRWSAIAEFPNQLVKIIPPLAQVAAASPAEAAAGQSGLLARPELVDRRTGTGSTMRARAPRPSRCPTPGSSRWSSRAFTCSRSPACSRTPPISNASASSRARNPSTADADDPAPLRLCEYPRRQDRAGAGVRRRLEDRRRLRMSTACRSASARMTDVVNPGDRRAAEYDRIGLTCAACHTGQHPLQGRQHPLRRRRRPCWTCASSSSRPVCAIFYTLIVPGRFERFADSRARSRTPSKARTRRAQARAQGGWQILPEKPDRDHRQEDAEGQGPEGHRRGIRPPRRAQPDRQPGFLCRFRGERSCRTTQNNLHANDAPVSFPPVWTVPWLWWAQYDASIEQPLIRNAGEALGVAALVNLSPDYPPDKLFSSSVALENLVRIEAMLRGPDPFGRESKGVWRADVAEMAGAYVPRRCRLEDQARARRQGPHALRRYLRRVPPRTGQRSRIRQRNFPDKSFWSSNHAGSRIRTAAGCWTRSQKQVAAHGNGPRAGQRAADTTRFKFPVSSTYSRRAISASAGGARTCQPTPRRRCRSRIALMIVVDKVSQKWMKDQQRHGAGARAKLWGERSNCPNSPRRRRSRIYRARPLNGVWATAPYLHNGSVPSLYWMLKPAGRAPKAVLPWARADFDPRACRLPRRRRRRRSPARPARPCSWRRKATAARSTATACWDIRSRRPRKRTRRPTRTA